MMRGRDTWAVAVRRPDGAIHREAHACSDLPARRPWLTKPMARGIWALVDSLSIGMRALGIAAEHAFEEPGEQDSSGTVSMGVSMILALVLFVGLFIVLPSAGTKFVDGLLLGNRLGDGAAFHLAESGIRILIFLAYLWSLSLVADIRRVFEYHGAEHKTIAAWEHGENLTPEVVDRYSTIHVRCGTNFLILVMLLAVVVYTLAGVVVPAPADAGLPVSILYHVGLRIVLLPVVAGLAYEGLRLGAARGGNPLVDAFMAPGLWLQKITTRPPDHDQIEVAIRAFEAVVPAEVISGRVSEDLDSPVVGPES